jgi:hypothetical protein
MKSANPSRVVVTIAVALSLAQCGGSGASSTPVTPSPPPATPTTPTAPTNTWTATGQIVVFGTGQPVGVATLTPGWSLAPVTTDANGNYTLGDVANPPTTPYPVSVAAAGMISRDVWITWARGTRADVTINLIRNAAPFSMEFYRQFARDTYDNDVGAPFSLQRWTTSPSFYVRTVDQNGGAIDPQLLSATLDALRRGVAAFTAGHYSAAAIETGAEARPEATDWIHVDFRREPGTPMACGTSRVGENPGLITLYEDACTCGNLKVPASVIMHEVGHAMGFFHVSDEKSVMFPFDSGDCRAGTLSAAEAYHAAVAYSRPRGNRDPDSDPSTAPTALKMSARPPVMR